MKFLKKHKYVIVRLVLMALLFVIGLHIGRSNRKTKTVLVEIPVENKCDCQKKITRSKRTVIWWKQNIKKLNS